MPVPRTGGFTAADLPPGPEDADGADLGDDEFFAAPEAAGDEEGAGDDDELFTQGAHAHTPKAAPQQARGEQRLATPGKRPGADAGMHNRDRGSAGGDGGKKRRREGQQRGYRDDGDGSGKRQRQLPQARAPDARGHEVGSHAPAAFLGGGAHANGGGHAQHAPSPGRFMHAGATFKPPQKAAKPKKKEKQPVRSRAEGGRKRAKKGKKGKGA